MISSTMDQDQDNQLGSESEEEQSTELAPIIRIGVETELSKYPIHNLSKSGDVSIHIIKRAPSGEVDVRWEVTYNSKYGPPRQLAYKLDTLIINRRIDEEGRPLPKVVKLGSLREIGEQLGLGGDTNLVRRALRQNAFAAITAKLKYRTMDGKEQFLEADFTRYSVIFTGEKFADGTKADAVYIELHPRYRDVLNNAPIRPLNYEYLKALAPSPQRFYEIISARIYAALKSSNQGPKLARILYSEFCTYSALTRHFDYENFRVQMSKIHKPHLKSGYIVKASYEETTDQEGRADWMMCYQPGPRARAEYMTFARKSKQLEAKFIAMEDAQTGSSDTVPTESALVVGIEKPKKSSPPKHPLLDQFISRGISQNRAQKILAALQDGQHVEDQLEWGDFLIHSQPGKIKSPSGFYVYLLTENISPPTSFETSRHRKAREQAQAAAEQERLKAMQLEEEYEDYKAGRVEQFLHTQLSEAELSEITARKRQHLSESFKSFCLMAPEAVKSMLLGAVKAEIKARVKLLSFEEFAQQRANQPSLFEVSPQPGQGTVMEVTPEPPAVAAIETPKRPRKAAITHQVDISAPPEAKTPHGANLNVTEAAEHRTALTTPPAEQGSEPSFGVEEVVLQERYLEFQRKEAQRALDRLEILERGRRMKAGRTYLLNEHPEKEHHKQLIAEGDYEQFHKISEDHLLKVTLEELRLPSFEDWKRYALSAITDK